MRFAICAVVMIMAMVWCSTTYGDVVADLVQATQDGQWCATALAGSGSGVFRVGWRPQEGRVAAFVQGDWLKDLNSENIEGFGGHVGATYDVIEETPLKIIQWEVPVRWYLGAMAGAVKPEDTGWQTSPGLLTGFTFGSRQIRVVIEVVYLPGNSVSEAFVEINDKARLLVGAEIRLP